MVYLVLEGLGEGTAFLLHLGVSQDRSLKSRLSCFQTLGAGRREQPSPLALVGSRSQAQCSEFGIPEAATADKLTHSGRKTKRCWHGAREVCVEEGSGVFVRLCFYFAFQRVS